jgi:hypothetical protein
MTSGRDENAAGTWDKSIFVPRDDFVGIAVGEAEGLEGEEVVGPSVLGPFLHVEVKGDLTHDGTEDVAAVQSEDTPDVGCYFLKVKFAEFVASLQHKIEMCPSY